MNCSSIGRMERSRLGERRSRRSNSVAFGTQLALQFRQAKVRNRREAVAEAGFAQGQLSAESSRLPDPQ
jgi:hypothetical protein